MKRLWQVVLQYGTCLDEISINVYYFCEDLTLFHMGGGGADSALLQIVFFITSVRDAAEPRNLVTKI